MSCRWNEPEAGGSSGNGGRANARGKHPEFKETRRGVHGSVGITEEHGDDGRCAGQDMEAEFTKR